MTEDTEQVTASAGSASHQPPPKTLMKRSILYSISIPVLAGVFLVSSFITYRISRYSNVLYRYENGRGFPFVTEALYSRSPHRINAELTRLPLNTYRLKRMGKTYILQGDSTDPGVFMGTHVYYETAKLPENRIRVTVWRYSHTYDTPWDKAVYEADESGITPLYINGGTEDTSLFLSLLSGLVCAGAWYAFFRILRTRFIQQIDEYETKMETALPEKKTCRAAFLLDPFAYIVLAPFVYYTWILLKVLTPHNCADSYAYLWRRTLNWYFLGGRGLTQRVMFYLSGGNLRIVTLVQMFMFAFAALTLYFMLKRKNRIYNLCVSLFIVFICSSYTFNIAATSINAEPVFYAVMLIFFSVLFLWPCKRWTAAALGAGVLFVFSKNVAPFVTLAVLPFLFFKSGRTRRQAVTVSAVLGVLSVISILVINTFDESLNMNTLNNFCKRVFPDTEAVAYFRENCGMPQGEYVEQLRGGGCGTRLDGKGQYTVLVETMNFRLTPDRYGLHTWIENQGRSALVRYFGLHRPWQLLKETAAGFRQLADEQTITYMTGALGPNDWKRDRTPNIQRWAGDDRKKKIGFFGFDPLGKLLKLTLFFGFSNPWMIILYLIGGGILLRFGLGGRYMKAAVPMLFGTAVMFFLSYVGDPNEQARHTFPAFILLVLASLLYWTALLETGGSYGWKLVRYIRQKKKVIQQPAVNEHSDSDLQETDGSSDSAE